MELNLPTKVCKQCVDNLMQFHDFKNTLLEKQRQLDEYANDENSYLSVPLIVKNVVLNIEENQQKFSENIEHEMVSQNVRASSSEIDIVNETKRDQRFVLLESHHKGKTFIISETTSDYIESPDSMEKETFDENENSKSNMDLSEYYEASEIDETAEVTHGEEMVIIKDSEKTFCPLCQKEQESIRAFHIHMNMVHPNEEIVCPICGLYRKNMSSHMRTHEKDRRFKCTYCPKAFNW